jgi:translocation and assembly module TamB
MNEEETKPKRSLKRWLLLAFATFGVVLLLIFVGVIIAFKAGYVDSFIRTAMIERFSEFGIKADIGSVKTTISPTSAELSDLMFSDSATGEKLAKINRLKIDLTISNILALNSQREVSVDSTNVEGLEVWVKFDEKGNSNFSNLKFKTDEDPNLKVSIASMNFSLKDAIIHYGDQTRKLSGEAKNLTILVEPENIEIPESERRYKFNLTSDNSIFKYNDKPIEPISVSARGVADKKGAEIGNLSLKTPLGESVLSGTLTDWKSPKYDLQIKSTVDLMQTASILPTGATLRGFGNFEGRVTGEGEKYKIDGEISSEALAADNVRLKGLQITGKIDGENSIYTANGKAIAEMLTVGDFQIDFPQIVGNVRGNGSDLKWFGELRAAAAKSSSGTIIGLILDDATAEYRDKKFTAEFGNLTAQRFSSAEAEGDFLRVSGIKLYNSDGSTTISAPNLQAKSIKTKDANLGGINANNLKLNNRGDKTDGTIGNLRAENIDTKDAKVKNLDANDLTIATQNGQTQLSAKNVKAANLDSKDAKLNNLNAKDVKINTQNGKTEIDASNVTAANLDANGAKIENIETSNLRAKIIGDETILNTNNVTVGKIVADGAVLGNLNIAGVRLSIKRGRITGESDLINAGEINLTKSKSNPDGGNLDDVKLAKTVFMLEPSGKYRASMDMSLGSGVLGKLKLGAANAKIVATNDSVEVNDLNASVMDGKLVGNAVVALNNSTNSSVNLDFSDLELAKIMAMQGGKVVPLTGKTTGKIDLNFTGTDFKNASGTVTADFRANAGSDENGLVPVNGKLGLKATKGLFDVDYANFNTEKSEFSAKGRFDLDGNNSNLAIALNSQDATEIQRLIRVLGVAPELDDQLNTASATLAGKLTFNGNLTGNIENPRIEGKSNLESIAIRGESLGSLSSNILVSETGVEIREGILRDSNGGSVVFDVQVPKAGGNTIALQAKLDGFNTGKLAKAFPEYLPERFRDFEALTSGKVDLTGLPGEMVGFSELRSENGRFAGEPFDSFTSLLTFDKTLITIKKFETKFGNGSLSFDGTYDGDSTIFDVNFNGSNLETERFSRIFVNNPSFPKIKGLIQMNGKATGELLDYSTYYVRLTGAGSNIVVNETEAGGIAFNAQTENKILTAVLLVELQSQKQTIYAELNLGDENLPLSIETKFQQTSLAPFIALLQPADSVAIDGKATGKISFGGNLMTKDSKGENVFTADNLKGTAEFTEFGLQFDDTPFAAIEPILVRFSTSEATVENAKFGGAGSNVVVSGTKALNENGVNNLSLNGKMNMRFIDKFTRNTFFGGIADVGISLTGKNIDARLSGTVETTNATIATFVNSERLTFDRIKAKALFTSNQIQIENAIGYVGGGKVIGSGGGIIEGLKLQKFRLRLDANNITTPLPRNYVTTGDAQIEITGERVGKDYNTLISGTIFGKRATYTKDIDLADVIGTRKQGTISAGTAALPFGVPKLDLRIEGREALYVKNNLADLVASVSLRLTGDIDFPQVSGKLTTTSGTLFFRNDRYEIRRGVLELPPNSDEETKIYLQAESEIKGYQIFTDLNGSLSDLDGLTINARSNPSLPQADVVSLITTGNLSNTDTGIPTLAQSGLNTAANILTDSLINNPARKATDKLFGLNKFEIDPILSGKRLNPTARLTVGRQINKNLAVTYSTNLSAEANQVLAVEYRVSNRLSFVAQYEQNSLGNVTQKRDNFNFEIRLRKRF